MDGNYHNRGLRDVGMCGNENGSEPALSAIYDGENISQYFDVRRFREARC
jgi:hypothetical protein